MNGDAVASLQSGEIAQHGRRFVYAIVEFLVGDDGRLFVFRLRHKNDCSLVPVLGEMAVYAVVGCVDLAAHEPFPEWGVAGVEHGVIWLEPGQHVGIGLEAIGKPVEAELLEDARVPHVRLCFELLGRLIVLLFLPVHGDLGLADLG